MVAIGQSFDKLAVARAVTPRPGMRDDLGAMAVLGPLMHLVESLTRPGVADVSIYELLEEAADLWVSTERLPSPERGRLILAAASLRLLDALGEAPDFEAIDHEDMPEGVMTLLRFMRIRPLRDLLAITAPSTIFVATSAVVETAVERTPLATKLHGAATIYALLA
jgi:recombinational DNA repair protein (RecF pathway)